MVDGAPVQGAGTSGGLLSVGEILAGLPPQERPDEIIGPPDWTAQLGYSRESGFIDDPGLTASHADHLHIGYVSEEGTSNTQ